MNITYSWFKQSPRVNSINKIIYIVTHAQETLLTPKRDWEKSKIPKEKSRIQKSKEIICNNEDVENDLETL